MNIGKAKITLRADGCIDCGTTWEARWETARVVSVVIDGRSLTLTLHRCGNCAAKSAPPISRQPLLLNTEAGGVTSFD